MISRRKTIISSEGGQWGRDEIYPDPMYVCVNEDNIILFSLSLSVSIYLSIYLSHCIALHCIALHCTALHCITYPYIHTHSGAGSPPLWVSPQPHHPHQPTTGLGGANWALAVSACRRGEIHAISQGKIWLVVSTTLKNMSQLRWLFPILDKTTCSKP